MMIKEKERERGRERERERIFKYHDRTSLLQNSLKVIIMIEVVKSLDSLKSLIVKMISKFKNI